MMFEDGIVICSECKETGGKMKLQEVEIVKLSLNTWVQPSNERAGEAGGDRVEDIKFKLGVTRIEKIRGTS